MINITNVLNEYKQLSEQEKLIANRKKELAETIKKYSAENGVKDDNGSFYSENDFFTYGSQARKSVKLNFDKAKNFFISKGLWNDVVEYEEKINEDVLATMLEEERLTFDELEDITDVKITYAVSVKEKEQAETMPEIQVVEKSVKPKIKLKRK